MLRRMRASFSPFYARFSGTLSFLRAIVERSILTREQNGASTVKSLRQRFQSTNYSLRALASARYFSSKIIIRNYSLYIRRGTLKPPKLNLRSLGIFGSGPEREQNPLALRARINRRVERPRFLGLRDLRYSVRKKEREKADCRAAGSARHSRSFIRHFRRPASVTGRSARCETPSGKSCHRRLSIFPGEPEEPLESLHRMHFRRLLRSHANSTPF